MGKENQKKAKQWKKSKKVLELLLFAVPAGLVILGALIVIFAKNPVHNSMGLVLTLASLAIIYITLNATFVAMVQMLVYAGAVMTLFLFVIMMIGVDKPEQTREEILSLIHI